MSPQPTPTPTPELNREEIIELIEEKRDAADKAIGHNSYRSGVASGERNLCNELLKEIRGEED